jgi:hypothetical protein
MPEGARLTAWAKLYALRLVVVPPSTAWDRLSPAEAVARPTAWGKLFAQNLQVVMLQ